MELGFFKVKTHAIFCFLINLLDKNDFTERERESTDEHEMQGSIVDRRAFAVLVQCKSTW